MRCLRLYLPQLLPGQAWPGGEGRGRTAPHLPEAADSAASPVQLGTYILNKLRKEVEDEIRDNLEKQRSLGVKLELLGRAVKEVEEKKKDMATTKRFEDALTKDVEAFR